MILLRIDELGTQCPVFAEHSVAEKLIGLHDHAGNLNVIEKSTSWLLSQPPLPIQPRLLDRPRALGLGGWWKKDNKDGGRILSIARTCAVLRTTPSAKWQTVRQALNTAPHAARCTLSTTPHAAR